jgi:hypothetical protein
VQAMVVAEPGRASTPLSSYFDSGELMRNPLSTASDAEIVSREHLVRLLLEQIERTFNTEGQVQALQQVAAMLRSLDQPALRGLVYRQGLQGEDELVEPEADGESTSEAKE